MPKALLVIPDFFDSPKYEEWVQLLRSLAECNFQVRALTTYKEGVDPFYIHKNVEVLQPFKKWNLFEMGALVRSLYGFPADIVHLILNSHSKLGKTILLALPGVLQNFCHPQFVLQLQEPPREGSQLIFKLWMQLSKTVLVEDDFSKLQISALSESHNKQKFHVLNSSWRGGFEDLENHWVSEQLGPYIYSCGKVKTLTQLQDSLDSLTPFLQKSPRHGVVYQLHSDLLSFKNSPKTHEVLARRGWKNQVVCLRELDPLSHKQLMAGCQLVSITHLPLGAPEISATLKIAREARKKVVVPPRVIDFEHSLTFSSKHNLIPPEQLSHEEWFWESRDVDEPVSRGDHLGNQLSRIYRDLMET